MTAMNIGSVQSCTRYEHKSDEGQKPEQTSMP